jgi:hypothetical protein
MGAWRPKHVEWPCRNKTCTVLHQAGVSFDSALIRRCDDLPATITHVPVAAVLVLNTPDDGRLRPKHVEWLCRNKTCTVLHQVGVSFDLIIQYLVARAIWNPEFVHFCRKFCLFAQQITELKVALLQPSVICCELLARNSRRSTTVRPILPADIGDARLTVPRAVIIIHWEVQTVIRHGRNGASDVWRCVAVSVSLRPTVASAHAMKACRGSDS